jgi:hypothetical protein
MFYILGPFDVDATKDRFPEADGEEATAEQRKQRAADAHEHGLVHFGKVEVGELALSELYQDTRDLIDKMKASELFSAEKNERDRKGYKSSYHQLIMRFGNLFKPPITTEEEAEQDIDCLALVENLIPELSVNNVEHLANVL